MVHGVPCREHQSWGGNSSTTKPRHRIAPLRLSYLQSVLRTRYVGDGRAALAAFRKLELPRPVPDLALGLVFRNTVALLDQADQLLLVALNPGDIVVRQSILS
jgi:hypothetical protein